MQEIFQVESLKVVEAKTLPLPENVTVQQIRLQFDHVAKDWYMLIIYKVAEKEKSTSQNVMTIDLGLDNLAAITFSHSEDNYLLSGKALKSINGYINKEIAQLQSIRMKQVGAKSFKTTKRIQRLRKKRKDYITNYLHQASRYIIELATRYQVGKIIIGDIKNIKQNNSIKTFVQIPIQHLGQMISYKGQLEGIGVEYQKENYTSGVSAFDLEPITKEYYNKARRITRGLFITNKGFLINADINGSLNILRQVFEGTPKLIQSARDNGCVNHPKQIRVA